MEDGTASSYYQSVPDRVPFSHRLNPFRRVNYWRLIPVLKLVHKKRYLTESKHLIAEGRFDAIRSGLAIRYEINDGSATFDVSPDGGSTYLNYLRAHIGSNPDKEIDDLILSIATIEAMIKTKKCVIDPTFEN